MSFRDPAHDAHAAQSRRSRVLLLALLTVFLTSGSPIPRGGEAGLAPLPEVSTKPPARDDALDPVSSWVEASLAQANPSLTPMDRARIREAVIRFSGQYGLDVDLVMAVILVESDARPWARSPKGAVGLMQVMPHMMRPMRLAGNMTTIESNIEAGCAILAHNISRLGEEDGISAYFWGSRIRGVAYLEKVNAARERVRGLRTS